MSTPTGSKARPSTTSTSTWPPNAIRPWEQKSGSKSASASRKRTALLKDFDTYRQAPQKKLRSFRLEAVRAGFRAAWATRDYATILTVADKLPEEVLQEDSQLLMWYDQALARSGAEV
jgi:hypothetical protein